MIFTMILLDTYMITPFIYAQVTETYWSFGLL